MRRRVIALLASVPLLLGLHAAPPDLRYAALGDSYAAGVGSGGYDSASGDCHRSPHAYPALWAADHHPAAFRHAACNSADTAAVLHDQLPEVPTDTTLLTLTVGGNDLGFADAAVDCLQPLTTEGRCEHALDESERRLRDELPDHLAALYQAIADRVPAATVVVTGYPHLLRTGATCPIGTDARRTRFNELADRLDDLIQHQAQAHGFAFADVRPAFAGHAACTGGAEEWIHGITLPLWWESFHPTPTGQSQGYLPSVAAGLDRLNH